MWAKQLKGHCSALCDLRAGHEEAGAAEAISGTLSCSRGYLPNVGQVKVMGTGWEEANVNGDAGQPGGQERPRKSQE